MSSKGDINRRGEIKGLLGLEEVGVYSMIWLFLLQYWRFRPKKSENTPRGGVKAKKRRPVLNTPPIGSTKSNLRHNIEGKRGEIIGFVCLVHNKDG